MKNIVARNLHDLLDQGREEELKRLISALHPADAAEILEPLSEEDKIRLFSILSPEMAGEVLLELSEWSREQIIEPLSVERLSEMVAEMDSDDAADIVADLSDEDQATVLQSIEPEDSEEVRQLLLYDDETAGGIMQLEMVSAHESETVAQVIESIRNSADEVEDLSYVFVVDDFNVLRGQVSLRDLLLGLPTQTMREIMSPCELVIEVHEDQEEVAWKFQKYDLKSAPVVDNQDRLLGRITVDDVFDVIYEEMDEDFLRMAGTKDEDIYSNKPLKISRMRLPWLLTNLTGGLVTGYLVWLFKVALQDVLALVTFIPAIMALGGSVGIQSSTLVVRGLALGRVGNLRQMVFKELKVALIMGLVCGLGGALVAQVWHRNPALGLVVGLSMFAAITLSSLLGASTPAAFRRLGFDPALASGPFVTMCNDLLGILIYMGIATLFMKFLI